MPDSSKKQYTEEFKLEAIRLAGEPDRSVAQVARDLGVNKQSLHNWIKQARVRRGLSERAGPHQHGSVFPGHGKLTPQDDEIRRLKRELAIVTEEREILKKATAFFAKVSK
jgi:transposase